MSLGIFGIGAIGSVISLCLNDTHEHFHFNRSTKTSINVIVEDHLIQKNIVLKTTNSSYTLDWLIICLKEYQFSAAEKDLEQLIHKNTKIAVIRNGIDLKAPILKYTEAENIIVCSIDCPVQKTDSGHFIQLQKPVISVEKSPLSQIFKNLFLSESIDIHIVDDFKTLNWKKVIASSALGGILALSGETCWIFKDKNVLELYKKIVEEGILVAQKEGAKIENTFQNELIKILHSYPDTKGSSMLTDRLQGHPIEINAKNGVISKYGKKHHIKTEINDMICVLLKYTNKR